MDRGSRNQKRSESPRHGKRKRGEDDRRDDRQEKKIKERYKSNDDRPQRDDRSNMRDERSQREERGHKSQAKDDRQPKDDRSRFREPPREELPPVEPPRKERERSPSPVEEVEKPKPKTWRDEAEQDDGRDLSPDDEALERKMAEARKRRQELMKKAAEASTKKPVEEASSPVHSPKKSTEATVGEAKPAVTASADKEEEADGGLGGMFDDSAAAGDELNKQVKQTAAIGFTGASGEDWDDDEGYYCPKLDELMDERYMVLETGVGKGVYAGVVKCQDVQKKGRTDEVVAVKVIRANDRMTKAAELEVALLKTLKKADKDGSSQIIRLLNTFVYRQHFCLVFECMWGDLRTALKTLTKNKGMSILAVRSYSKQLLSGLRHMMKCKIIHCDIKPDNILISKGQNAVKFCDLGTAVEISGVNATPYLGSGCYRSPEIVLGAEWAYPVDTWALAATLCEIFIGRVLMPSKTNNQHLKIIMDYKGKIPAKVIKKGSNQWLSTWKNHFTDELDFKQQEAVGRALIENPNDPDAEPPPEMTVKIITDLSAKKSLKDVCMNRVGPERVQSAQFADKEYVTRATQFADLLENMFGLDPEKRISPSDALAHAFCQDLGKKKS